MKRLAIKFAALLAVTAALVVWAWWAGSGPGPLAPQLVQAAPPAATLPEMVTADTIKAIDKGLEYLAHNQRNDGSWLNSGGMGSYPAVMTSLAGLAFLSSGSTPETGKYCRNVRKAMYYTLRLGESDPNGLISGPGGEGRSMYGHGFAMLFLAQCYGMDLNPNDSKRIRAVLDRGIKVTVKAQSDLGPPKHAGGWIYTPDQNSDEGSVTVTQLQALRACRNVGIKVPKACIERAVQYLKYCQESDGGICYSAQSRGSSRPPISAAAIACFYAAGVYDREAGGAEGDEAKMVAKLLEYCKRNSDVNRSEGHWYYTHFYMAQGFYQHGGQLWKDYYPKVRDKLISQQNMDGSWMGDGVGTTYGTGMALVVLQLPFGYLPICQK